MSYMQAAYEPLCTNSILYDMLHCNAKACSYHTIVTDDRASQGPKLVLCPSTLSLKADLHVS